MTAASLPRFWPPQHWATRQRLRDPAEALWSELRIARGEIEDVDLMLLALEHCEDEFARRGDAFRRFDQILSDWVSRGLVSITGYPFRYSMLKEFVPLRSPPAPPAVKGPAFPKRTQRQRLWTAMKVLRAFDLPTLLMASNASRRSALDLIRALERGGWLRATAQGWMTSGSRKWGPVVPTMRRTGSLIRITDPVSRTVIEIPALRDRHQDSSTEAVIGGGVS